MSVAKLDMLLVTFAVFVLILPVANGFAVSSGYESVTVCSNNNVSACYITTSVYSYNSYSQSTTSPIDCRNLDINDHFTMITMTSESSSDIPYQVSNGRYTITGAHKITADNLFFMVENIGFGNVTFKIRPYAIIDSVAASAYGSNCVSVTIDGLTPDQYGYYTISPRYAYHITANATFNNYSSSTVPPDISTNIYLEGNVSDVLGIYAEQRVLKLVSTGSGTYQDFISENGSTIEGDGGTYNVVEGPVVNGNNSVILAAQGNSDNGIVAGNDGHVGLTVTIPRGKEFVIGFDYENDKNKTQKFNLSLKRIYDGGSQTLFTKNGLELTGNGAKSLYVCKDGYTSTSINNYTEWISIDDGYADSDKITVTISDIGNNSYKIKSNTVVYLVFKST